MICVFAGTFDPVTTGHEKIIKTALSKYERVIVVLGVNESKTPFFSEDERYKILKACFKKEKNISVVRYSKIKDFSAFLKKQGVTVFVRGVRNGADLTYEREYEKTNEKLYPFIKTEYISAENGFTNISSSLVRDRINNLLSVEEYIPVSARKVFNKIIKLKRKQ